MKIKHSVLDVRRSEVTTTRVMVPNWEVPILEALHPGGVTFVKGQEADRDPPEPAAEMERLSARYGKERKEDGSLGDAIAANVYGKHQAGITAIAREIDAAIVR